MPVPLTVRDVARAAGVSASSVSRAMTTGSKLTAEKREHILGVAKELGYRRNPLVAALLNQVRRGTASQSKAGLALVAGYADEADWDSSSSNTELWRGAKARAELLGYGLERFWLDAPGMTAARLCSILHHRGILGAILCDNQVSSRRFSGDWSKFAIASQGYLPTELNCHRVSCDYAAGMKLILAQLSSRGYRRIGLALSSRMNEWSGGLWKSAYLDHQHHLPSRDRVPMLYRDRWGLEQFSAWLKRTRPEVVITHRHKLPDYLEQIGLRAPNDYALVNIEWRESVADWAGVNHRYDEIGAALVDVVTRDVENNLSGPPDFPRTTLIAGQWIEGRTLRETMREKCP